MSITVNVNGVTGGGSVPPSPPPNTSSNTGGSKSGGGYQAPNLDQFTPGSVTNVPLPTSDALIQDIRREMATRGVVLVPGSSNYSTMMNQLRQSQQQNVMGSIDSQYQARIDEINKLKESYYNEVDSKIEAQRQAELYIHPHQSVSINRFWESKLDREFKRGDAFFNAQIAEAERNRDSQKAEAEQRLTEAIQRLTETVAAENKDSYLNNLRKKYREQIQRRDDAETEAEAREASREAAKIQERMQRAQGGGRSIGDRLLGATPAAIGGLFNVAGIYLQGLRLEDQMRWGLPVQMSRAMLGGDPYSAYSQEMNMRQQRIENNWQLGGAGLGAIIGILTSIIATPAVGMLVGAIASGLGSLGGSQGGYFLGGGREAEKEKKRADASSLWTQAEGKIMQFNALATLLRPNSSGGIGDIRDFLINQSSQRVLDNSSLANAFIRSSNRLDLYDLGYTSPEFSQQVVNRVKSRGFSEGFIADVEHAIRQDALERYYNMSPNSLSSLSAFDRFGRNNATQDFANLVATLESLGTTGMSNGYVRGEEFAGYMSQLQSSQRSTFLSVDNARAGRQIATAQSVFGNRLAPEVMQGIQSINNQVQNPGGGIFQALLYDIIQELYPDTRGDLRKIQLAQYDPAKQNEIQKAFAQRLAQIYGGPDTTGGFLAMQGAYGIKNANVLQGLANQMVFGGGLEAKRLKSADVGAMTDIFNKENYTPKATQSIRSATDEHLSVLLQYQEDMVDIAAKILSTVRNDINESLKEVAAELKN